MQALDTHPQEARAPASRLSVHGSVDARRLASPCMEFLTAVVGLPYLARQPGRPWRPGHVRLAAPQGTGFVVGRVAGNTGVMSRLPSAVTRTSVSGMVSTVDHLATGVGVDLLRQGRVGRGRGGGRQRGAGRDVSPHVRARRRRVGAGARRGQRPASGARQRRVCGLGGRRRAAAGEGLRRDAAARRCRLGDGARRGGRLAGPA